MYFKLNSLVNDHFSQSSQIVKYSYKYVSINLASLQQLMSNYNSWAVLTI